MKGQNVAALVGYFDSDLASEKLDRDSTSGHIVFLCDMSHRKIVALSRYLA